MEKRMVPFYLSIALLLGFTIYFILKSNYEFLVYAVSIGILISILIWAEKRYSFPAIARWGFFAWLAMHMLGGSLYIKGTRLYDLVLINIISEPFFILRYGQFVHTFCYVVIGLLVYRITSNYFKEGNAFALGAITFLASIGIGAVNEIIEFSTVALFNSKGVGDYFNNSLDLIFNAIGALIALVIYPKKR